MKLTSKLLVLSIFAFVSQTMAAPMPNIAKYQINHYSNL